MTEKDISKKVPPHFQISNFSFDPKTKIKIQEIKYSNNITPQYDISRFDETGTKHQYQLRSGLMNEVDVKYLKGVYKVLGERGKYSDIALQDEIIPLVGKWFLEQ
jgi:hypothetical protein